MKTALVVLLFAASAFAQDPAAIAAAESACGPQNAKFDVKPDALQHPSAQPVSGKALVYVIEDLGELPDAVDNPVTKVGMDGTWVGANRGSS
jgi:hypothetical protein